MAVFNLGDELNSVSDVKQIKAYLYKLNEELQYMFSNLTPDDNNASSVPKLTMVTSDSGTTTFEISADGVKAELMNADNVISSINLSKEGVKISGTKISLNGAVSVGDYVSIDASTGKLTARSANFSGTITASTISGSNISCRDLFIADYDDSEVYIGGFYAYSEESGDYMQTANGKVGMGSGTNWAFYAGYNSTYNTADFRVTGSGSLYCADTSSQWGGMSVGEILDWIGENWP